MDYLITFLEGIITFISPCLLPMLPIYISYFAGQNNKGYKKVVLTNAIGFVLGFTLVFLSLGAFSGAVGKLLREYNTLINVVSGIMVILFGLNFMEFIRIPIINTHKHFDIKTFKVGFLSSILFGAVFAISWTPCVGAFLGSALMLAASSGESLRGILLLLSFSLGLGIPFIVSAVLIDRLKSVLNSIKKHYRVINLISGGFLVIVGVLMITGFMGSLLAKLTF